MLGEAFTKVKLNYRPFHYSRELIKALLGIFKYNENVFKMLNGYKIQEIEI